MSWQSDMHWVSSCSYFVIQIACRQTCVSASRTTLWIVHVPGAGYIQLTQHGLLSSKVSCPSWLLYSRVSFPSWLLYSRVSSPSWLLYSSVSSPSWLLSSTVSCPSWLLSSTVSCPSRLLSSTVSCFQGTRVVNQVNWRGSWSLIKISYEQT